MFRHFISTEPLKRNSTEPPSKDATPAKQQKTDGEAITEEEQTEGEAITEEEQTNWDNIQQMWQGLANQDQATRMEFLEERIFSEDGPFYDAWANYCNLKSQFSDAFYNLLINMGDNTEHMRPYLHTLFYDAVTYNSEAFGVTVEYLSENLPDLSADLRGDRLVLINAMTENNERPGQSSIDMIQYASTEIKNNIDFMCEYVLQYDGEWIGVIDQENLTPDAVDWALRGGEYDRRDILEHIWPVIMHNSHIAREALDWCEEIFERDDFKELYGNNDDFMRRVITKDYHYCQYASDVLLSNMEFVTSIMTINPNVFQYLQAPDKNNPLFIEQAVSADWRNFQFAHNHKRGLLLIPAEDDNPARLQEIQAENIQEIQADGREMVSYLLSNVTRCGQLVQYTPFTNNATIMEQAIRNRSGSIFYLGLVLKYNPEFLYKMLQRVTTGVWMAVWNRLFRQDKLLGQLRFFQPPASTYIFEVGILLRLNQSRSCLHFFIQYRYWLEHQAELLNPTLIADTVSHILKFTNT